MKKILLIASSSLLANKIILTLEHDTDVALTVLLPSEEARSKVLTSAGTHVIVAPGGKGFCLRSLLSFRASNRGDRFDEVIVLYNNKTGYGYLNVDLYSLVINAGKRYAYNYDQEELSLDSTYIARKAFHSCLGLWWRVINTLFLGLLLGFIFCAMTAIEAGVWCSRLFTKKEPPL